MREIGIDLNEEFPKPLTDEVVRAEDVVITMGCGGACPIYPGKRGRSIASSSLSCPFRWESFRSGLQDARSGNCFTGWTLAA